jgi:hypothetical protein
MIKMGGGGVWSTMTKIMDSWAFNPASLFKSGDIGLWFDATDFATMRPDNLGVLPQAISNAVYFALDKSKGLKKSNIFIDNLDFNDGFTNWINTDNYWTLANHIAFHAETSLLKPLRTPNLTKDQFRTLSFNMDLVKGGVAVDLSTVAGISIVNTATLSTTIASSNYNIFLGYDVERVLFKRISGMSTEFKLSNFKLEKISGNHAVQRTASKRPILQSNGVIFDGIDDELSITFDIALSNCTIVRAFEGTVTVQTGQAVSATYSINESYSQHLVINRLLTASEQAQLTAYFEGKMA